LKDILFHLSFDGIAASLKGLPRSMDSGALRKVESSMSGVQPTQFQLSLLSFPSELLSAYTKY